MDKKKTDYLAIRNKEVVKANELIQRSRFSLSVQQQKLVLYLIAQINQYDDDFKLYELDIKQFCKVCDIDAESGRNYELIKEQIKAIADKSLWITLPNGVETLIRWVEKPYINPKSGIIQIRLDRDLKPYLLQIKENFTRYELIYTLHFRSKYSIRLYELIKSLHFDELNTYEQYYRLDDLKRLLDAENHKTWQHFKDKVLAIAIREINEYSDKIITYEPIKTGRTITHIKLTISTKETMERVKIRALIDSEMSYDPNQYSLFDDMGE